MTGQRILVVDDSAQMRDFVARTILGSEGYAVDTARDGSEGLASALANSPALIITDLAMPEMNGLEMVQALREEGRQIPVILITAEGSEDLAVQALRLGVMDYFVKPFDPDALLEAVQRILHATRIGGVRTGVSDQRQIQVLNTLIAISKQVMSVLDLEVILSRVVEAAVYITQAEEGSLMLVDDETGELVMRVSKNLENELQTMRLPGEDSLIGRVIQTGQPLLIGGKGQQQLKTRFLVRSLLYAPLRHNGRVIGVLGVHNRESTRPISPHDAGFIMTLADYAAIAISNARQYSESEINRTWLVHILQWIEDPVLVVGDDQKVMLCNHAAYPFLDRLSGDKSPLGRTLDEVTSNPALLGLFEDTVRGEGRVTAEVAGADGHIYNAHASVIEGVGSTVVMQDITHLKELDRAKSELVEMVSHQVRSPLTAILSYVELMGRTGNLSPDQLEFTRQMRHNVRLVTETINDLLELGKIEAGMDRQREPVALADAARYAVDRLRSRAEAKQQELVFEVRGETPVVLGNALRLRQAFVNLVENAIKYTQQGGMVYITVFHQEGQAMAQVADTGIGITVEDQRRVFDKFYRANKVVGTYEGTGLGLSIVKSIIEAHEGRVWVDSHVGQGTTFTIVLPLYESQTGEPSGG